jgi:hypothetical protein
MWFAYIHCWATDMFPVLWSDARLHKEKPTITEKDSLKSETVKYGHESQGTRTRERLRW